MNLCYNHYQSTLPTRVSKRLQVDAHLHMNRYGYFFSNKNQNYFKTETHYQEKLMLLKVYSLEQQ